MKATKKQNLIKGIIYDDQSVLDENVLIAANMASEVLDHKESMGEFLNECKIQNPDDNTIPTADEMNAYGVMLSMINPGGKRNLVIPSDSLDDALYDDLKKIDIGPDILSKFDEIRLRKMIEEEEADKDEDHKVKIHFVNREGTLINTLAFNNESEAADFIGENFAIHPNKPKTYVAITEPLFSKEF